MRRVVVTGIGIVSAIGDNVDEVAASLKAGKSGVSAAPEYADLGFKCQVHARPKADPSEHVDKRAYRFMGEGAGWAFGSKSPPRDHRCHLSGYAQGVPASTWRDGPSHGMPSPGWHGALF